MSDGRFEESGRVDRGENGRVRGRYWWVNWLFPVVGLVSLLWFLIRVAPRPSRATYPCQRVAMPFASGFVVWLVATVGSAFAYRHGKVLYLRSRLGKALVCFVAAGVVGIIAIAHMPESSLEAVDGQPVNVPIGTARGIFPGRVVWVHDPNATDWTKSGGSPRWYDSACTDATVVEQMLESAVLGVSGRNTVAGAWDAIFRYHNIDSGKGDVGYVAGETIGIKINFTTCNASGNQTHNKGSGRLDWIDNSPQMTIALFQQLVDEAGVDPCDISIGDPTSMTPNYWYNIVHGAFPNVRYFDQLGGEGRERVEYSDVEFYWNDPCRPCDPCEPGSGVRMDYIPVSFADADYFINFAVWKGHSSGVTLCGKNNYGSLIRMPTGWERDSANGGGEGMNGYYSMHWSLPNDIAGWSPGTGYYRGIVNLMGHEELGGKTLLYLLDGLFAGYYWESIPRVWDAVPPFDANPDWPSSVLVSLDPVAIDSVAYDFLLVEWPRVTTGGTAAMWSLQGGAEDYLHEAALADNPPSGAFYDPEGDGSRLESLGVHEHWNNATDKQYTRNLGAGSGIELYIPGVTAAPTPYPPCWDDPTQCHGDFTDDGHVGTTDWPQFRDGFGTSFCGPDRDRYIANVCADLDRDGDIDTADWPPFRDNFGGSVVGDCPPGGTWPPICP